MRTEVLGPIPICEIKEWHRRPVAPHSRGLNALTVDVEDYFQVEAFFRHIDRSTWDNFECRVERNVETILELLSEADTKATFFTLGWVARRYPSLVKKIVAGGHELASHGSEHRRLDSQASSDLLRDLTTSKQLLEDIGGQPVRGFRAPSFSITAKNLWALSVIAEVGYQYSSSIYPISHDNYGIPEAPRFAFHPIAGESFIEIPVTSVSLFGKNWPCGGGGYFRLLPYALNELALKRVVRRDQQPCVFYFHPWEIDAGQPRIIGARLKSRFRHYTNLSRMQPKLRLLLRRFDWDRMDRIFLGAHCS